MGNPIEIDLLNLEKGKGEVETLLKQIWLNDHPKNNNLLDGSVLRLRRLFTNHPEIQIKSVYATGYILESGSEALS